MKRETVEWLACMLVASVGLFYAIWVVPYIPSVDGPQHILSAHIENHFSDAGSTYPSYYGILPQFAGKGFALVFGPLESILPWRVALRITFSLFALAFAWGFALVVLAIDRTRRATAMLGFVIALPWSLYMGFFAFVAGTTFGLYVLALALNLPPNTLKRRALLSLMLLVQAVCHVFTAIMTGIVVAVLAVVGAPKGERLREVGRVALVGAPAAVLFALTFRTWDLKAAEGQVVSWAVVERFHEISRWFVPGPGVRGWAVIVLVVFASASILRRKATAIERALACLALVFLGLSFFTPLHMPGWFFLAPRFVSLAMVLGLALVRLPATRAAVPVVTACCLVSSLVSASVHRELASGCADVTSGLDAPLHFEGPRLPIVIDSYCGTPRDPVAGPVPRALMAYNTPLLYLVDHGGIGTKMFNGVPSIHAISFVAGRRPPPPDTHALTIAQSAWVDTDPKLRKSVMTELAADGMPFEGIHVVGGRPEDFAVFNERGYVTEWTRGSLFIGRFEGCPAELVLQPGALDREPVFYEYGLFSETMLAPEPRILARALIKRDTPLTDGAIHVPLRARPCGEVWVRVVWDADKSSSLSPGDRTCENATWQGRVRVNLSRDHAVVSCISPP